LELAFKIL